MLQVTVEHHHRVRRAVVHSCDQGGLVSKAARQHQHFHPWIGVRNAGQDFLSPVGRRIKNVKDPIGAAIGQAVQYGFQSFVKKADDLLLPKDRADDVQRIHCALMRSMRSPRPSRKGIFGVHPTAALIWRISAMVLSISFCRRSPTPRYGLSTPAASHAVRMISFTEIADPDPTLNNAPGGARVDCTMASTRSATCT